MSIFRLPKTTSTAEVAQDWERSATARQGRADALAAEGKTTEAKPWAAGAREAREHAAAARQGRESYEAYVNGW
ncbi:hypothetical protein ACIQY8_30630 [Streptomyces albidoflavus]